MYIHYSGSVISQDADSEAASVESPGYQRSAGQTEYHRAEVRHEGHQDN